MRAVKGDTYYGKVATQYEDRRAKQGWWWREHEQLDACLAELPGDLRLLDVPFGTGRFLPIYHKKNFAVSGLDSSADMISQARLLRESDFDEVSTFVGSAMELPFDDDSFDALVSVRFLTEIVTFQDAAKALEEFVRVTQSYVIVELSECEADEGRIPNDHEAMRDLMNGRQIDGWLSDHGLRPERRFRVRHDKSSGSSINLILCQVK